MRDRDCAELVKDARYCSISGDCVFCNRKGRAENWRLCQDGLLKDAADAIEELLAAVPKWISVEERLPEESGYTIVFCADGERRHVAFAKYQKTPKRWELTGARSYWRVLRWMSLPEPPKEVER